MGEIIKFPGRPSIKYTRPVASVQYVAGAVSQSIQLPKDRDLSTLMFYFSGTATVTVAGVQLGSGIAELIKRITVRRNGSEVIANVPLTALAFGNVYRNRLPTVTQPNFAAVGATAFEAEAYLDLSAVGFLRPKDAALRCIGASELTLEFEFAPLSAAASGTYSITAGGLINVQAFEEMELPGSDGMISSPSHVRRIWSESKDYSGATSESLLLPRSRIIAGVAISTKNAAGGLSAGILGGVSLRVGSDYRQQITETMLRESSSKGLPFALPTGWFFLDLCPNDGGAGGARSMKDALDTYGSGQDVRLEYTTLTAGKVNTTYFGYEVAPNLL